MRPLTYFKDSVKYTGMRSFRLLSVLTVMSLYPADTWSQKKSLDSLEINLSKTKQDSLRVVRTIHFTRQLHYRRHDADKEYRFARKAVNLSLKLKDTLLYARALDNLGLLYRYHHWYVQAIPLHIKAWQLVATKKVPALYKMIFANNTGLAARYNQQYDLAVEYYLKALNLAEKHNNLNNISISSNGLGNALSNIPGREEEALSYFLRGLKVERENDDSLGMAMDILSISNYFIKNKDFNTARNYLDTLYYINKHIKDTFGLAITNEFYGHAYFKEGKQLSRAKDYYTKALLLFQQLKNPLKEAELLKSIGDLQYEQGHLKTATNHYLRSLQLATHIQNKGLVAQSAYQIAKIKEQQNKYREALSYYRKAKLYEDSIALNRQKVRIAALSNQYQLDKKESKINTLQKENLLRKEQIDLQQEKLLTHRIYFIILLTGILLIALFISFQYRNKKVKRQAKALLQNQQAELLKAQYEKSIAQAEMLASRSQLNPHFLFNSLNSIHLLIQKRETKNANDYLIKLSRFMRMILELPKSHVISLEEELNLINYYIALEAKRFEHGFSCEINALSNEEMKNIQIPPLLLQPFVENAIWHGLLPSEKESKSLYINIKRTYNQSVTISIEDNGVGRQSQKHLYQQEYSKDKRSMGMKITKDRIDQFNKNFDCKIDLRVVDKLNATGQISGTRVVLSMKESLN